MSPAKNLQLEPVHGVQCTEPAFHLEAARMAKKLGGWSVDQWSRQMGVSRELAQLNVGWLRQWGTGEPIPAAAMYAGEAFKSLHARGWATAEWRYASEHLLIGSGLYGMVRATDGLFPYRLEMDVKLPGSSKRLSGVWAPQLTAWLDANLPPDAVVLNLMSDEYARAVQWDALNRRVFKVEFLEKSPKGYHPVSVFLKKARGLLADFVIRQQIEDVADIRRFTGNRYAFVENSLTNNTLLFNQF